MKIRYDRLVSILLALLLMTACGMALAEPEGGYVWEHPVPYSLETEIAVEEKVNELAAACRASGAEGDYEIALWMHDWLIYNADYDQNEDESQLEYGADGVLLKRKGVCNSYMLAYELLMNEMGIENKRVYSMAMNHTWNLVKLEGEWYHVDCTWDDPKTEEGGGAEHHGYFGLSDALMGRDHTWDDADTLPACTSNDCNYYIRSGEAELVSSQEEFNEAIRRQLEAGNTEIKLYNVSMDGFDLAQALGAWWDGETWRYGGIGYSVSYTDFMMNLSVRGYDPTFCAVEYITRDQLAEDLGEAFAKKPEKIYIYDHTGGAFNYKTLYEMVLEITEEYYPKYGCKNRGANNVSTSGKFILLYFDYDEVSNIIASGECGAEGDNVTWELDADGVLTISGEGEMKDYYDESSLPWYSYRAYIKAVTVKDGVTSVGQRAFSGCNALASISLPGNGVSVGKYAFYGCSSLTSVSLPEGVTAIEDAAFWGCSSLDSVSIPSGVTSIGYSAFRDCSSLTSVSIPMGVNSIGLSAFENCSSLESVSIPESVTLIDASAFRNCSALASATIPEGVTTIGNLAFFNCSSLTIISLPDTLTTVDMNTFSGCTSLKEIVIPGESAPEYTLDSVPEGFMVYCMKGSKVEVWAKENGYPVAYLADPDADKLILPAGVTAIEAEAFAGSAVQTVILPDGCETIGSRAFADCDGLISIYMPDSISDIAEDAFDGSNSVRFVCESENKAAIFARANGIDCTIE